MKKTKRKRTPAKSRKRQKPKARARRPKTQRRKGAGAKTDTASDEHAGKGTALDSAVGQVHCEAGRPELGIVLKVLHHSFDGTGVRERVVVEKDNVSPRGLLNAVGLGTASGVAPESDQSIHVRFERVGRAVG